MAQLPVLSSQSIGDGDLLTTSWPLEGSEDTGWLNLETIGALPELNQPGYANWDLTFPPGAQISNVGLEVGVDGSNGISIIDPELYSPDSQYTFFDWSGLGGLGQQDGFITGAEHNGRLSPNSDAEAQFRIPDGAEITDLVLSALRPADPAVAFMPLELDIRDSEVDPEDGRLYIAMADVVLQLDHHMDPMIIHLRENITANDIHLDLSMQRLLIVHESGIGAYNMNDGQYLGELPAHPDLGDGEEYVFTHVIRTTFDLLAISPAGLFSLDATQTGWTSEQQTGLGNWPTGIPQDVELVNDVLYVSIMGGGVARWDTLWRSSMTPFEAAAGSDFTSTSVHEMVADANMLYIASADAGLFRYSHVQSAWLSPWTANNRLDDNNIVDLSAVDDSVFILGPDVLHELDSNTGIISGDHDVRTDLSLTRTAVDIIPWPSDGGVRGPPSGIALLGDGTGRFSVLDPAVQGLWVSTMNLASGPTGTDMTSVVQIGSSVYVSSEDIIDIFDLASWRWAQPITGIGQHITAMTTEGSVLYVATQNPVNIYEMDTSGSILRIWGSADLAEDFVIDLVWDDTGYLVASHDGAATVINLATSGSDTYSWDFGMINDVAAQAGVAYLASAQGGVLRIDLAAGTELSPWRSTGLDDLSRMPIEAGNGMFYLGVPGYGVLLFDQTTGDVVELWTEGGSNQLPDDDIRTIHIDGSGYVYVGTSQGAVRFDGTIFETVEAGSGWWGDTNDIFYDFESDNDHLWAAMEDDEICRWAIDKIDERLDCWDDDDGLPDAGSGIWYDGLRFIGQNDLMVMTNNGAAVFDTNSLTVADNWVPSGGANSAPVVQWNDIIYLGLNGDGIARYDVVNDQWLTAWTNATSLLPGDEVTGLALDESREMLWAGGEFGLAQIDLQTGLLADNISISSNGLNGNPPQLLLIYNDILHYVPVLSSFQPADIARIDLSNNSGLDVISVGDGHIQAGGDGDGIDAYIHGLNIINDLMYIGVSEAAYQGNVDEGRIIRYNLSNESWEEPWETVPSIDRVVTAYIDPFIYATYDSDLILQIDDAGNIVQEWEDLLDGPVRDILQFEGEVLFATDAGIARFNPTNDTWLSIWNVSNGGLHPDVDDEILDLYNYTDSSGDSELWYSSGVRQGGIWSTPPSVNRISDDRNGDGIINGSDHENWQTGITGLPAGDAWSMEVCSGELHVAVRWNGQFGGGGGVGRFDLTTGQWNSNEWTYNNGLEDDDVTALACDEQDVIYIGYEGDGSGISRYDHASASWMSVLDNGDGISEDAVWYDGMDWLDGILVAGHYGDGFSTIDVNGSASSNGQVLSAGLEVSSVTPVSNAPFGTGFILGRPGTDVGSTRLDWYSGGQLNIGQFHSMLGFTSGAIETFAGNATHIYITPTDSRFSDMGITIIEGLIAADGTVEWTEEWSFGLNTIKRTLLEGDSLWMTTAGLGLWRLDLSTRQLALVAAGLSPNLDGMHLDGNTLSLGLASGVGTLAGAQQFDTNTMQWGNGRFMPGLLSSVINDVAVTNLKTWFATPIGVAVWNNSLEFWEESLTVTNGMPSPVVDELYVHSTGELWMGTPVGLVRYDPVSQSFNTTVDMLAGLVGDSVSGIAESNGKLFLSHNGGGATTPGASVLDPGTLAVDLTVKIDQLPSNDVKAVSVDSWGVHIATSADPIMHYNLASGGFENGISSWQIGNSTALDMVSDGVDLFILLPDRIVRVDASGITHSLRDEWFVNADEQMFLDNGGLFAVGSDGMYGWSASPQFELLERYLLRYADPLDLAFADSNYDLTTFTHPGQQIVLASSVTPIVLDDASSSGGTATIPYTDIPVILTSTADNAATYLRSETLLYSGTWNLSEFDPDIGTELQLILDSSISTTSGIDLELRLKSPENGSMMVRLTYDWTRSLTSVDILDLIDRPQDGGGFLQATWTASPDPDFKAYHLYLLSIDSLDTDLSILTTQTADAISSSLSTTSLDVGTSLGTALADGTEYWAVVFVEYGDDSFGPASTIVGPAVPLDDIPAAPDWGSAAAAQGGAVGDIAVEWSRCTAMDNEFLRIHIYENPVSDAMVVTNSVDFDQDGANSTVLVLEAGQAYWFALTCVDTAGQEDLANPFIIGPIIPTGGVDDGEAPPKIADVLAYDTPDDEGGIISIEWTASDAEDCAFTTVYVMDSNAWAGWDVDPVTGQDVRTDTPLTATEFAIGRMLTDCSINSTIISSVGGVPLIDGELYFFAVVAADEWFNENRMYVDIVEATPERQLDEAAAKPPSRIQSLEAWDTPLDGGTAIQVSWTPSEAIDFAYYIVWANSQPVTELTALWEEVGDDQQSCGCIRVNQQHGGAVGDAIEVKMDRARYGPEGTPLDSADAMQKGIIPATELHIAVTVHDLKGYVWLTSLQTVEVLPVNNLDDTEAPDLVAGLEVADWPADDGSAVAVEFVLGSDSDIHQYAVYSATEQFDTVGFNGPPDPVTFLDRTPQMPVRIDHLSNGEAISAGTEVWVAVVAIDSAGNSITSNLVADSAITINDLGADPGAHLPAVENLKASWTASGDTILIEWDALGSDQIDHYEIYVSNSAWDTTQDAAYITSIDPFTNKFELKEVNAATLDNDLDWYIGVATADDVAHRNLIETVHVKAFDSDDKGMVPAWQSVIGNPIALIAIFSILIIPLGILLLLRMKKRDDESEWETSGDAMEDELLRTQHVAVESVESVSEPLVAPQPESPAGFPGWTQEMVDSYLDQGWSIEQLKEWFDQNS